MARRCGPRHRLQQPVFPAVSVSSSEDATILESSSDAISDSSCNDASSDSSLPANDPEPEPLERLPAASKVKPLSDGNELLHARVERFLATSKLKPEGNDLSVQARLERLVGKRKAL